MAWSKDNSVAAKLAAAEALLQAQRAEDGVASIDASIAEVDAVVAENTTRFLPAVATVALRDSTYTAPLNGDTVRVTGTSTTYRFSTGSGWVVTDVYNATAIDNVTAQLADTAKKKQLPLNIVDYGAVGDGITDNVTAFSLARKTSSAIATNRIANNLLITDTNVDGLADSWTNKVDNGITGSNSITDGQKLTVSASANMGGNSIYQDVAVSVGEVITLNVEYKSENYTASYGQWLQVLVTGGASIGYVSLPNVTSYTTGSYSFTVPSGCTSIRIYMMGRALATGNTGSTTFKSLTMAVADTTRIIKFPQNETNNAVYYFSSTPDLSKSYIDADNGVKLSFPTTNSVSFKTVNFLNDIDVVSRDRANTGTQFKNNISKLAYATLSDNDMQIGVKKLAKILDTSVSKTTYSASTGAATVAALTFDSASELYNGSTIVNATNKITTAEFPFQLGHMYNCDFEFTVAETNTGAGVGITVSDGTSNFMLYYLKADKNFVKGIFNGSWTAVTNNKFVTSLNNAYDLTRGIIFSCRAIANNKIEIYLNGVFIDIVTTPFVFTRVGFGMINVNATNQGLSNVNWGRLTGGYVKKSHNGNVLNLYTFGDSITFGEGAISWAEHLPKFLEGQRGISKINVTNKAVSGANASGQLAIMQQGLPNCDMVCIMIGTNDIQSQTDKTAFKNTIQSMIDFAVSSGVKHIVLGIPPMFINQNLTNTGFTTSQAHAGAAYRSIIMSLVAQNDIWFADTVSEFGRIGVDNYSVVLRDNLHPTVFGEVLLARCFARSIISALTNEV